MEDTKRCTKCGEVKPVGGFDKDSSKADGLQCHCRTCNAERRRRRAESGEARSNHLMYQYGLSTNGFNAILVSQGRCCRICGRHEDDINGPLHVDHDHNTGKIRGLLCGTCNRGIGIFGDSPEGILRAYEYLLHNGESVDAVLGALEDEAAGLPSQEPIDVQLELKPTDEYKPSTESVGCY